MKAVDTMASAPKLVAAPRPFNRTCVRSASGPSAPAVIASGKAEHPEAEPPVSLSEEWKIPASADVCGECGEPLPAGEPVTTVFRLSDSGPQRMDLCATCAESVEAPADSFIWRRSRPEPVRRKAVVDYAMLIELFGRLLERSIVVPYAPSYSGLGPDGAMRLAVFASHDQTMLDRLFTGLAESLS